MQRRDFLKTVSFAAAALGTVNLAFAEPRNPLGVQLYTVRDALKRDLNATLDRLTRIGFTQVELFGYDGKFFGKTSRQFRRMLKDRDLKAIGSHHVPGIWAPSAGTLSVDWERTVDDLHEIGVGYAVCAYLPNAERTPQVYRRLPKILETCARTAQKAGIATAYHNHDFEFEPFDKSDFYDFLLAETAPDLVKMEADLYWMAKAGKDPLVYFERYPGRFPLWHVKDKTTDGAFAEVGQGTLDFDWLFAQREKAGLQHWFIEQDESTRDIFDSLQMSRDFVVNKGWR